MNRVLSMLILAISVTFASQAQAIFTSPDPMDPTIPGVGTNRYAYSQNDPINKSDPTGLCSSPDCPYEAFKDHWEKEHELWKEKVQEIQDYLASPDFDPSLESDVLTALDEFTTLRDHALSLASMSQAAHGLHQMQSQGPLPGRSLPGAMANKIAKAMGYQKPPIWSQTKNLSPVQNALAHWNKHKGEFPEYKNATQYAKGARDFVNNPPVGTQSAVRVKKGETIYYDPNTNTFAVVGSNGAPKTMFRPSAGQNYWETQLKNLTK